MSDALGEPWRVRRTSGLLVPGFTKRFDAARTRGTTCFLGVPVGRFDMVKRGDGACELRYRLWPVVDVLAGEPGEGGSIAAEGTVRAPGGRRVRFCRFRLERQSID